MIRFHLYMYNGVLYKTILVFISATKHVFPSMIINQLTLSGTLTHMPPQCEISHI